MHNGGVKNVYESFPLPNLFRVESSTPNKFCYIQKYSCQQRSEINITELMRQY